MLKMLNPWVILGVVLALGATGTAGYVKGSNDAENEFLAETAREQQIARIAYDNALAATASEIAKIEVTNKTIRQDLEREIRYEPIYIDCRHTPGVKRLLDAILLGEAPAESFDPSVLPATDSTE